MCYYLQKKSYICKQKSSVVRIMLLYGVRTRMNRYSNH